MESDKERVLQDLILRAIRKVLSEQCQDKRPIYDVFADSFDCRCIRFLHSLSSSETVTVIVEDRKIEQLRHSIETACPFAKLVSEAQSTSLPLGNCLTVYPVASQDFIVKAALGIADTFATKWLARCFSAGAAVHLQLSGLARFTGHEPEAYAQRILMYYRQLLEYNVTIGRQFPSRNLEVSADTVVGGIEKEKTVTVTRDDTVLTAADLYSYKEGTTLIIGKHTIVTACALEEAMRRGIDIRRT